MSSIRHYRTTPRSVTLRRVERGWDASQHLRALLAERKKRGQPYTHEWLAATTGIRQQVISSYATDNPDSRRNLGVTNGAKIAEALGVTLTELGQPTRAIPNGTSLEWVASTRLLMQLEEWSPELRAVLEAAAAELEASGREALEAAAGLRARLAREESQSPTSDDE